MRVVLRLLAVLSVLAAMLVGGGPGADAAPTSPTPSATPEATPEPTAESAPAPVASARATATATPQCAPTPTPTADPTATPSATPGATPGTPAASPTSVTDPCATPTPTPSATPDQATAEPTATAAPGVPPTPSPTATPGATPQLAGPQLAEGPADPRAAGPAPTVGGAIGDKWNSLGGMNSFLGGPLTAEICGLRDGGCYQVFTGGSIYWSMPSGAWSVRGSIAERWGKLGWETGALGYPRSDEICGLRDNGCVQRYTGGNIYWSPRTPAVNVWGSILNHYAGQGWESGALGYPTAPEDCSLRDGGCVQSFTGGLVYSSKSGTFTVKGAIGTDYARQGYERGPLGYPTSNEDCSLRDGGCVQRFTGGLAYYAPGVGAYHVRGSILDKYAAGGYEKGRLGYPTSGEFCGLRDGGCGQRFTGGLVLWSPGTGAHTVWGGMLEAYAPQKFEAGPLGYPTSDEFCGLRDGGCGQRFTDGLILWSAATGPNPVRGSILDRYAAMGYETGAMGYPSSPEFGGLVSGGVGQRFANGMMYYTAATGAQPVRGAIQGAYGSVGFERSKLGYPTEGEFCGLRDGGCAQRFAGGMVYYSPAGGAQPIWGAILGNYAAVGYEKSKLGYPTSGEFCGLVGNGCGQRFETGYEYFSPGTGTYPVWGAIRTAFEGQGWEKGPLGYPIEFEFCGLKNGGCAQRYERGIIYWSPGSGPNPVRGAIFNKYGELGWETGTLGYPTSAESAPSGGKITQKFQGGELVFDQATGQVTQPGAGGGTGGGIPLVPGSYPDANAYACGSLWCKNGSVYSERGFAYRNCTDFAAWKRGMVWSEIAPRSGDGNARGWRQGWVERGRTVSSTPKVGAIAWWAASSTSSGYGHTAIVTAVNPDGTASVEEYNWATPGGYGTRKSVRADAYLY
ncbi:CHAP domain-containing protein [Enemella evansiae]|uniref:CHAP domain-containing protein n=1 Tax=Enemella evansiae TaxID=2016499 RepID=UPI00113FD6DF|nr:CHAP domain-containing protein [Enemella evansiae]